MSSPKQWPDIQEALDSPVLVIDTEGNGKDLRHDKDAWTMGISPAWRPDPSVEIRSDYYPYRHYIGPNLDLSHLDKVAEVIEKHPRLVFHNAKYDLLALENMGVHVRDRPFYDTMLMGHWLNENALSKGLDFMSQQYGGMPKQRPEIMKQIIKVAGWDHVPAKMMGEYSAHDAFITLELFEKLYPLFEEEGYTGELWELEERFLRLVLKMEGHGIGVDQELCASELERGHARMQEISDSLNGLNPNSPKDLEVILIDALELEPFPRRTPAGALCFDKEAMAYYEEELELRENEDKTARLVLEYRGWLKATSAYYGAYLKLVSEAGNLHPNFKLHGTRTGRLSCEKPNLQQIPRVTAKDWNGNAKKALKARPGFKLWEIDYSNLEFRLGAIYSNEHNMIDPLVKGFKPFDAMAELLFGVDWTDEQRQLCKVFTYMTSYGAGIAKIARIMSLSPDEAEQLKRDFFAAYPRLRSATRRATMKAETRGYALLWSGRRRHFEDAKGSHKAFNAVIQGGAAELVKRIMLILDDIIDWDNCKMLLQVHDSVVFEIREGYEGYWLPILKLTMANVEMLHPKFGLVPFPVEGKPWGK